MHNHASRLLVTLSWSKHHTLHFQLSIAVQKTCVIPL